MMLAVKEADGKVKEERQVGQAGGRQGAKKAAKGKDAKAKDSRSKDATAGDGGTRATPDVSVRRVHPRRGLVPTAEPAAVGPPRQQQATEDGRAMPLTMAREDVGETIDNAAGYLVSVQRDDGSWGNDAPKMLELGFALNTYRSWRLASHAISTMALAAVDETPERLASLASAVRYMST